MGKIYSTCYMASVRMYNRALTDAEVQTLSQEWEKPARELLPGQTGILINSTDALLQGDEYEKNTEQIPENSLLFHFSGKSSSPETGQTAITSAGSVKYNSTIQGISCAAFQTGGWLRFPSPGLTGEFDATVSAWINLSSTPKYSYICFIGWGRNRGSSPPTSKPTDNYIGFFNAGGSSISSISATAGSNAGARSTVSMVPSPVFGEWYHLMMTIEKNSKSVQYFLNGKLFASKILEELDIESSDLVLNSNLQSYDGHNACCMAGLRIYDRVLSEKERQAVFSEWRKPSVNRLFIPVAELEKGEVE